MIHVSHATRAIAAVALLGWSPLSAHPEALPDDVVVKLERTSCFGECPVYSVTIDGKGNVTYVGTRNVRVVGRRTARIPPSRVAALLSTAERIGFFDLRDQYRTVRQPDGTETTVTDLPTAYVTVTSGGRSKRVEDYFGAPEELRQFENEIDEAAGTRQWTSLPPDPPPPPRARRSQ